MAQKGKLAVCVATFDHPRVVEHIICYCVRYLRDLGIDIYYYDSSSNDETKEIIRTINNKGFDNVFHIPVSPDLIFGQKVDLILSGYGLEKDYEYIWPIKDRLIHNEFAMQLVLERINKEPTPDILVVLMLGDYFGGYYIDINSPVELYKLFGKQTTSIGTVIYNRNTMLDGYVYGESSNAPRYRNDFWHYDFMYKKMAAMPSPVISIISKENACTAESNAAPESGWRKSIWQVWIEEWIQCNFELPDIYTPYKLHVIKDTTSIAEIMGSRETFIKLHEDGLLTKEIYEKYADMWDYVTTVPAEEIKKIAYGDLM